MFLMLFVLNVILATLNLIPIPPLDGSRVLGGFLSRKQWVRWMQLDRWGNYVFLGLFVVLVAFPTVFDATFGAVLNLAYHTSSRRVTAVAAAHSQWRLRDGLRWLQWESVGVAAVFPTREGGISAAPFDSLNLGLSTDDDGRRRARESAPARAPPWACRRNAWSYPGRCTARPWPGSTTAMAGHGASSPGDVIAAHDALLTASPGLGLAISYADCVPVVIAAVGPDGPCLATVHAGWRGMLAGIVASAAAALACRGTPRRRNRRPEHRAVLLRRRRRAA